jgi:DNA-binding LacI/PurR family transcriptional regulator
MRTLNYVPNAIARSLANSSTKTIGFTIARPADQAFANPFFSEILRGIASVSQRRGYKLMLSMSSNHDWETRDCLQMVREKRIDGLILSTVRTHDPLVEALVEEGVPFVVIGRSLQYQVPMVNNDNIDCGAQATRHLALQGRQHIAFISGSRDLVVSVDRIEGYRRTLQELVPHCPERILETSFTREGGYLAMAALAAQGPLPDSIVAADDLMALGAIDWLKEHGYKVPEDVAVVGFNDDPVAAFARPPLTTVRVSTYHLGLEAGKMLLDILGNGTTPEPVIVPGELVIRKST